MVLVIGMWVGIIYCICKGIAGSCMRGHGKAGGIFIFNVVWFTLCMYLGATTDHLGVAVGIWAFVGTILNALMIGSQQRMDNPDEREKMRHEVEAIDKYDNDYGIYDPKKK